MSDRILAAAELTVDLDRVADNYRALCGRSRGAAVAGVVKADGYGLGAVRIAETLSAVGCRDFFVAQASEGVELRAALERQGDVRIYVLAGAHPGTEADLVEHHLRPVLNSLEQIERWALWARQRGLMLAGALHIDTGLHRLGLSPIEVHRMVAEPRRLDHLSIELVMSHLASADEPDADQSIRQREQFMAAARSFSGVRLSLANSSGIHLGSDYHFDLVRPGYALYGGNPTPGRPNPMRPVVALEAPVVQVSSVSPGDTVGYGATHVVQRPGRVATLGLGYGDGFSRALSGRGRACVAGIPVPIVGRISMDLLTVDVTEVPESELWLGRPVELLGEHLTVDEVAAEAGTIGYEILTGLGNRYHRRYRQS